jgi:hypothetical protein
MTEVIALTIAGVIGGASLLGVLALILFPLEDQPYRHPETGELVPCGCGCQR